MLNEIKKYGYMLSAKYVFLGTILAVLVFQFTTISIVNRQLDFNSLINRKTIILLISGIIGVFTGGLIQVLISINDKNRKENDLKQWTLIKEKNKKGFLIIYALAFSFGGLVAMLTKNALNLITDNEFFPTLFSSENIADYFGAVLAASVFGLLFALGTTNRLKLLYGDSIL